jgi:zinc protease
MRLRTCLFTAAAFLFMTTDPCSAEAAKVPALPESRAEIFTYDNGLTLIVEVDRSAPVASVQAWCGTGSIHEGEWMGAGLSHILEHMLFKGTEKRPPGAIADQIQRRGGYINAYTSFDRTVYWIDTPAEGAPEAVEILADVMQNATLPEEEYVKEQEVIRREFAMGFDDPNRQASELMLRTVFSESPFRHPVIGYLDVYNSLTRDNVLDYYKSRYVPNNITFVVVGDVDAVKIREELGELFKSAPRRALEPVFIASEPPQLGRREIHEEFPTELSRLSMSWRIPGVTHADTPALEILGEILGSGASSRLNREIRERKEIAHQAGAGMYSLQTEGIFVMQAVTDPDKRDTAERESLAVLEDLKKDGITDAELERARRSILASQIQGLTTMRGKASDLGSNWKLARNLDFTRHYLDEIAKVTREDIRRVANKYLTPESINVTSLNPPGTAIAKSEAADEPAAGEIQKFTLPNGLRLLVREDPRLPLVSINAVFRGGLLAETRETNGITRLYARALLKGTKNRTAEQIADEIEGVGGSIGSDSGNNSFSVGIDVMSPDLALGVEVLSDILLNPAFPEREVELERRTQLAGIKADEEQVTSVARNLVRENLFGSHPYGLRNLGAPESVSALTPDQLREFHATYACARNGVVSVFGDVKADEVKALFEKLLSSLPEGNLAFENVDRAPVPKSVPPATAHLDKKQAVLMIGFQGASVDDPDRLALELLCEASSDLGSRFFNRIREQMGLAYFVGAAQFNGLAPGAFLFYLGTDPKKLDKVTAEMRSEIEGLANSGLTPEELERARAKLIGAELIRNQSNSALAGVVAVNELMGLGHDAHKRRKEKIEKISLDDIRQAAAKYFHTESRVEAAVLPPAENTQPTAN